MTDAWPIQMIMTLIKLEYDQANIINLYTRLSMNVRRVHA